MFEQAPRPWPGATPALAWWWLSREISRRPWLRILFPGGKERQISQNLTPSKIKKWRDKLQDQSITEMESITISARVSLNNTANLAAMAEWIVKYSEWSWIMAYVFQVETWPTDKQPGSPGSLGLWLWAFHLTFEWYQIASLCALQNYGRATRCFSLLGSKMPPNPLRSLLDAECFL